MYISFDIENCRVAHKNLNPQIVDNLAFIELENYKVFPLSDATYFQFLTNEQLKKCIENMTDGVCPYSYCNMFTKRNQLLQLLFDLCTNMAETLSNYQETETQSTWIENYCNSEENYVYNFGELKPRKGTRTYLPILLNQLQIDNIARNHLPALVRKFDNTLPAAQIVPKKGTLVPKKSTATKYKRPTRGKCLELWEHFDQYYKIHNTLPNKTYLLELIDSNKWAKNTINTQFSYWKNSLENCE